MLATLATLTFFALLPRAWGWEPVVVVSNSMAPVIVNGDIVVTSAPEPALLTPGVIAHFETPARRQTLMHRIAAVNADGTLTTKGDANSDTDSTPVAPHDVRGVGRLVVPFVGYLLVLANEQRVIELGIGGVVLLVLAWASRWGLLSRFEPELVGPVRDEETPPTSGVAPPRLPWVAALLFACALAGGATVVAGGRTSAAAFTGSTQNSGDSLVASPCFASAPVSIGNFFFNPDPITINVGCTVLWTNTSNTKHTTTSNTGVWDSGQLSKAQSFSFTFNAAGTYLYRCALHPATMSGKQVIVQ